MIGLWNFETKTFTNCEDCGSNTVLLGITKSSHSLGNVSTFLCIKCIDSLFNPNRKSVFDDSDENEKL